MIDRSLSRMGWIGEASPLLEAPEQAGELGLGSLTFKRDDLLGAAAGALPGGTKLRKLDVLLAQPPWRRAERWASVGAIGSGHLSTLAAASRLTGRPFDAYLFWTPPSARTLEDLAATATAAERLVYSARRATLIGPRPWLLGAGARGDVAIVPPGATTAPAMAGLVLAALELAAQVRAGLAPPPDRLVVPLGTGGTAAGLLVGLALAGLPTRVHAVATVERLLSPRRRLARLVRELLAWLAAAGHPVDAAVDLTRLHLDRAHLGRGYGVPTPASLAAVDLARAFGLPLEPVYSGKALAALRAQAPRGEHVLFWVTPRRAGPLPAAPDWRDRLPPALARRLAAPADAPRLSRRRVLVGGAAALALGAVVRTSGYPDRPGWRGRTLGSWQAHVLAALAEALLPPAPDAGAFAQVPAAVDRFVAGLSPGLRAEIHLLVGAVEHGTPLADLHLRRLSNLSPEARRAHLEGLAAAGGLRRTMARGLRDLVMLGYYQQDATWPAIGYGGPWVRGPRPRPPHYEALVAPAGALPRALVRPEEAA